MTEYQYRLQIQLLESKIKELESKVENLEFQAYFWKEAYHMEKSENYIPQLLASGAEVEIGE